MAKDQKSTPSNGFFVVPFDISSSVEIFVLTPGGVIISTRRLGAIA
jgi:hypothetical protein